MGTDGFTAFEHRGWQRAADAYADAWGSLTTQGIPRVLDAVGAGRGTRILDVASGPGYVAAAAAERGADVVGLDFSSAMVERAGADFPAVDFRQGSAEDLPFAAGSFDAVVINFGLFHFAHPDVALAEAFRVLRPGGRVAFTAWAKPDRALMFGIVLGAIAKHGRTEVGLPQGPGFFQFSDPQGAGDALRAAGFEHATFESIPQTWRLPSPASLFEVMQESTVRTAALLAAQTAEARARIAAEIAESAKKYQREGAVEIAADAVLATGRRSASISSMGAGRL